MIPPSISNKASRAFSGPKCMMLGYFLLCPANADWVRTSSVFPYNDAANWDNGVINGRFSRTAPNVMGTGTSSTFNADTTLATGLDFSFANASIAELRTRNPSNPFDTTSRTLTLGGNILMDTITGVSRVSFGNNTPPELNVALGGNRTITVASGDEVIFRNRILGSGTIIKEGAGILSLNGDNAVLSGGWSGGLTLNGGILQFAGNRGAGGLTDATRTLTFGSGTSVVAPFVFQQNQIFFGTNTSLVFAGNVTFDTQRPQGIVFSGPSSVGSATRTITVTSGTVSITRLSASASGAGIIKEGSGVLELYGNNPLVGIVRVGSGPLAVSGSAGVILGSLELGSGTTLFGGISSGTGGVVSAPVTLLGNVTFGRGDLPSQSSLGLRIDGSIGQNGGAFGATIDPRGGPGSTTYGGTGSNSYAGTTTLVGGDLFLQKTGTAVAGALVVDAARHGLNSTVILANSHQIADTSPVTLISGASSGVASLEVRDNRSENVGALSGNGSLFIAAGSTFGCNANGTSSDFSGAISGSSGSFVKAGSGVFTLNGTIGTVEAVGLRCQIDGGSIALGSSERIDDLIPVVVAAIGTLNLSGYTETIGSISGSGKVILGTGGKLIITGDGAEPAADSAPRGLKNAGVLAADEFEGTIEGDGSVEKSGSGILVLAGNNTHTGGTIVSGGELVLRQHANLGPGGVRVAAGGTLSGIGTVDGNLTVEAGGAVVVNGGTLTLNGPVTNNGFFLLQGGARLGGSSVSFTNNGTLDLITAGAFAFPAGFVNNGTVFDSSVVRAKSIDRSNVGGNFIVTIRIDSHTGHTYSLERSTALDSAAYTRVSGATQSGNTGTVLTFTDFNPSPDKGFYRIAID